MGGPPHRMLKPHYVTASPPPGSRGWPAPGGSWWPPTVASIGIVATHRVTRKPSAPAL
jgi:hypothetical protein